MGSQYIEAHPNHFNQATAITVTDDDTVVVTAKAGYRIFITDLIIVAVTAAAPASFTLTDDAGVTLLGPVSIGSDVPFIAHFQQPLVNETTNDQVEMDKSAADDDWQVFISGYYAA